ncbi:sialate O-acetylesterase [Micromonospora okii]|uniref:sialate O-acetylesterase n=1 Tax=Micromonospora okii TaxID=1182970 RepID=UPI001E431229|nr:sialate O-acetylesterase [Micromonospora okii]
MSGLRVPVRRLRSMPRPAWAAVAVVGLLLASVAVLVWPASRSGEPPAAWSAPDGSRTAPAVAPVDATSCAANAAGMTGFVPVAALDLPARADWRDRPPAYAFDRTAEVARGFDRVGYCLELTGPAGPQWVWTAMEAFTADARRLGPSGRGGPIVRQRVNDVEVATNVPGLSTGTGLPGYLEMWPNSYGPGSSGQVAGASGDRFDADDDVYPAVAYGSFQVHLVGATRPSPVAPQTVLAVNGFTSNAAPLSLGIGTAPGDRPDWTFAANAAGFSQRRLTVYARPSVLTVDQHPADRQLYPRDAGDGATVTVSGTVTDRRVTAVQLKVTSGADGWEETAPAAVGRSFALRRRITAGLREYRVELRALGDGVTRRVGLWEGVVAGDVYVVQGQSNAVAGGQQGSSAGDESRFLRSYGSPVADRALSAADRSWHYAVGDPARQPGSVGQWAIRAAHRLMDTYQVPVAVVNGAENGRQIGHFQRRDAAPDDLGTNYGRLRQRLRAAGVIGHVRAVLWYQGEADDNRADTHVAGFTALLRDWRAELGADVDRGTRYYVFQVRTSPCGDSRAGELREAQRRMGDTLGVTLLSTNGLSGQVGCHFAWEGGYRELGDHVFAVLARDLHGGPGAGVAPPNPRSAAFGDAARTELVVQLRGDDPLRVDPGVAADFRLAGTTATVVGVAYREGGRLVLTLSGPAGAATAVSYLGRAGAGPAIVNPTGAGLLTFADLPISPGP